MPNRNTKYFTHILIDHHNNIADTIDAVYK